MIISDFNIGQKFFGLAGFEYLCTDKGTRTISAIHLEPGKPDYWFIGPPYSVQEIIFDEYDMTKCYKDINLMITNRISSVNVNYHPGYDYEDFKKMSKHRATKLQFAFKKLLSRDRLGINGEIFHPYSFEEIPYDSPLYVDTKDISHTNYIVLIFEVFSREFSSMHINDFIKLKFCSNEDLMKRKDYFEKK